VTKSTSFIFVYIFLRNWRRRNYSFLKANGPGVVIYTTIPAVQEKEDGGLPT
jgi:hypothetical protein